MWRKVLTWKMGSGWRNVSSGPWPSRLNGSYLLTYAHIPYDKLIQLFGEPDRDYPVGDTTDAEWRLEHEETGAVVAIYNWKDGVNYLGTEEGTPIDQIEDWSIGGHNPDRGDINELLEWIAAQP